MSFEIPEDCLFLDSHEWVRSDADSASVGEAVRVGISDFAQDELGDVVFVELPTEGTDVVAEEAFGVVESIKAVSDLYAPVSGTVTAVNEELETAPELVNEDPYGDGWMMEVELADTDDLGALLDAEAYSDQIE